MSAALDIRPYRAEPGLVSWAHWGTSDRLTVCFSGIGERDDPVQPYEFARTATMDGRDHALFIADTNRSWLSAPRLIEEIVAMIEGFASAVGAKVVQTLGHSMGGFMALTIPGFTRVDSAVAFSPQASVHPEVAGDDPRWMFYRDHIDQHRIRSVMDHINDTTRYFALHGQHKRERFQRERFEARRNLTHIVMPRTVHEVPQKLRQRGIMEAVVSACFDGRMARLRELLQPLEVRFRKPGEGRVLPPSAELMAVAATENLEGDRS